MAFAPGDRRGAPQPSVTMGPSDVAGLLPARAPAPIVAQFENSVIPT